MKIIEIDDELYQYIASQTQHIGESASSILRRLLPITVQVQSEKSFPKITRAAVQKENVVDFSVIQELIKSTDFKQEKKSVMRFLAILSRLYHWDNARFSLAAASLHGSKRRYLATSENALGEYGKNTKPKPIIDTPYWVVTNNNTARKCHILATLMQNMVFPKSIIEEVIQHFIAKNEA